MNFQTTSFIKTRANAINERRTLNERIYRRCANLIEDEISKSTKQFNQIMKPPVPDELIGDAIYEKLPGYPGPNGKRTNFKNNWRPQRSFKEFYKEVQDGFARKRNTPSASSGTNSALSENSTPPDSGNTSRASDQAPAIAVGAVTPDSGVPSNNQTKRRAKSLKNEKSLRRTNSCFIPFKPTSISDPIVWRGWVYTPEEIMAARAKKLAELTIKAEKELAEERQKLKQYDWIKNEEVVKKPVEEVETGRPNLTPLINIYESETYKNVKKEFYLKVKVAGDALTWCRSAIKNENSKASENFSKILLSIDHMMYCRTQKLNKKATEESIDELGSAVWGLLKKSKIALDIIEVEKQLRDNFPHDYQKDILQETKVDTLSQQFRLRMGYLAAIARKLKSENDFGDKLKDFLTFDLANLFTKIYETDDKSTRKGDKVVQQYIMFISYALKDVPCMYRILEKFFLWSDCTPPLQLLEKIKNVEEEREEERKAVAEIKLKEAKAREMKMRVKRIEKLRARREYAHKNKEKIVRDNLKRLSLDLSSRKSKSEMIKKYEFLGPSSCRSYEGHKKVQERSRKRREKEHLEWLEAEAKRLVP